MAVERHPGGAIWVPKGTHPHIALFVRCKVPGMAFGWMGSTIAFGWVVKKP
jgi:hypothetical protein